MSINERPDVMREHHAEPDHQHCQDGATSMAEDDPSDIRLTGRRLTTAAFHFPAKVLIVGSLMGISIAFAADGLPSTSIDVIGELWAMMKAAGILGSAVLGYLLYREIKRGERRDAEISHLRGERDSMQERTLTALISSTNTMEDATKSMVELVKGLRDFMDWFKDEFRKMAK